MLHRAMLALMLTGPAVVAFAQTGDDHGHADEVELVRWAVTRALAQVSLGRRDIG